MKNRKFKATLLLTGTLGIFVGYRLSGLPNLQPYKLLNIVGLLYNLLAVFVLSEVLVSSVRWKQFCIEWVAPILMWSHVTVPPGAIVGAGVARLVGRGPSAPTVFAFAFSVFWLHGHVGGFSSGTNGCTAALFQEGYRVTLALLRLHLVGYLLCQLIAAVLGL